MVTVTQGYEQEDLPLMTHASWHRNYSEVHLVDKELENLLQPRSSRIMPLPASCALNF